MAAKGVLITRVGRAVIATGPITAQVLWYSVLMSGTTDRENTRPARRLDAQLLSHVVLLQIVACNASIEGGEAVLANGVKVGRITSAPGLVSADRIIAFACMDAGFAATGLQLSVYLSGSARPALILQGPLGPLAD